jgi:hypothetical protein
MLQPLLPDIDVLNSHAVPLLHCRQRPATKNGRRGSKRAKARTGPAPKYRFVKGLLLNVAPVKPVACSFYKMVKDRCKFDKLRDFAVEYCTIRHEGKIVEAACGTVLQLLQSAVFGAPFGQVGEPGNPPAESNCIRAHKNSE